MKIQLNRRGNIFYGDCKFLDSSTPNKNSVALYELEVLLPLYEGEHVFAVYGKKDMLTNEFKELTKAVPLLKRESVTENGIAYSLCSELVPNKIMEEAGSYAVSVQIKQPYVTEIGITKYRIITSKIISFSVDESFDAEFEGITEETSDILQKSIDGAISTANNAENIAQSVRDDADKGKFNGRPFVIHHYYLSIEEMIADYENEDISLYDFVMIQSAQGVEDEDNSKLYSKVPKSDTNPTGWLFISDLSGAVGETGATPVITASAEQSVAGTLPKVVASGTPEYPHMLFKIPAAELTPQERNFIQEASAFAKTANSNSETAKQLSQSVVDRANSGEFNGEKGKDGVLIERKGMFGFQIRDGDLFINYSGDVAPTISINSNGELLYSF